MHNSLQFEIPPVVCTHMYFRLTLLRNQHTLAGVWTLILQNRSRP